MSLIITGLNIRLLRMECFGTASRPCVGICITSPAPKYTARPDKGVVLNPGAPFLPLISFLCLGKAQEIKVMDEPANDFPPDFSPARPYSLSFPPTWLGSRNFQQHPCGLAADKEN